MRGDEVGRGRGEEAGARDHRQPEAPHDTGTRVVEESDRLARGYAPEVGVSAARVGAARVERFALVRQREAGERAPEADTGWMRPGLGMRHVRAAREEHDRGCQDRSTHHGPLLASPFAVRRPEEAASYGWMTGLPAAFQPFRPSTMTLTLV